MHYLRTCIVNYVKRQGGISLKKEYTLSAMIMERYSYFYLFFLFVSIYILSLLLSFELFVCQFCCNTNDIVCTRDALLKIELKSSRIKEEGREE